MLISFILAHPVLTVSICSVGFMRLFFLYAIRKRRIDVVDIFWASGMAVVPVFYAIIGNGDLLLRWTAAAIGGLWYLRLTLHLYLRFKRTDEEDSRYQTMRAAIKQRMKRWSGLGIYLFFLAQAFLIVGLTMPFYWLSIGPAVPVWALLLAVGIALVSLVGVTIADHQLLVFKANNPRSAVMDQGLWAYSRHPNYFFEWLHWWAYVVLGVVAGIPLVIVFPLIMFLFLYYFTGVPFSEKQALMKRGAAYQAYCDKTPVFMPRVFKRM